VEKSESSLTSFAGLPLIADLAHSCGLIKRLNAISGLWERKRDYSTADHIMSLALTLIAGGERLDDTRLLKNDAIVSALNIVFYPVREYHRRFFKTLFPSDNSRPGARRACAAAFALRRLKTATIDIDSSLIESDKETPLTLTRNSPATTPCSPGAGGRDLSRLPVQERERQPAVAYP